MDGLIRHWGVVLLIEGDFTFIFVDGKFVLFQLGQSVLEQPVVHMDRRRVGLEPHHHAQIPRRVQFGHHGGSWTRGAG
mgnify:CR=1 FL=1